jgi:hypothetical protein
VPFTPGVSGNPHGRPANPIGTELRRLEQRLAAFDDLLKQSAIAAILMEQDAGEAMAATAQRELAHMRKAPARGRGQL